MISRSKADLLNLTGISNFGTIIIKGFGFSTLVTTLMQIPYGAIIALSILICVFANEYVEKTGRQARSWFILLFLAPNIAGAFGLAFLETDNQAGRLVSYYLTGPYNAAFVMVLSMSTANTAGHTKKVVTNGSFAFPLPLNITNVPNLTNTSPPSCPLPRLLHREHRRPVLLPRLASPTLPARHLEHDRLAPDRSSSHSHAPLPASTGEQASR
jgi:hypothetical protein